MNEAQCPKCTKKMSACNLKRHLVNVHKIGVKTFPCQNTDCKQVFQRSEKRLEHMRNSHGAPAAVSKGTKAKIMKKIALNKVSMSASVDAIDATKSPISPTIMVEQEGDVNIKSVDEKNEFELLDSDRTDDNDDYEIETMVINLPEPKEPNQTEIDLEELGLIQKTMDMLQKRKIFILKRLQKM